MKVIENLVLAIIIIIVIFEKKNHTKLLTNCICVECIVGTEKRGGKHKQVFMYSIENISHIPYYKTVGDTSLSCIYPPY